MRVLKKVELPSIEDVLGELIIMLNGIKCKV